MEKIMVWSKGFLIGIANIIPGVSGGTFALILGIFERLMDALKSIDLNTIKVGFGLIVNGFSPKSREDFWKEWEKIDGTFLLTLCFGAGSAILASSWIISFLLKDYPALTLSFFIGLILPSLLIPYKMMPEKKWFHFLFLLPGVGLTVGVALGLSGSTSGSLNPGMAFLSGILAISAMILPGISGSFVLLVMGQYQNVIDAIKTLQKNPMDMNNLFFLFMFGMGCLIGLVSFARLISYLLKKVPSPTLVFLIGLILGSFWVLWPFKVYSKSKTPVVKKRKLQIATAKNRLPKDWKESYPCGVSLIFGIIAAGGVSMVGREKKEGEQKA